MTESQIERIAESKMDNIDAQLMRGLLSQSEYEEEVRAINRWVASQYRRAPLRTR